MLKTMRDLQVMFAASAVCSSIVVPMAKSNDIKESFSALLRDSLRARYGRIPSAAVVAREFNLRAYETSPISQESARRWLRGVSLPEEERLRVLVNWLNLDFNAALKPRAHPTFYLNNGNVRRNTLADDVYTSEAMTTAVPASPITDKRDLQRVEHTGNGLAKEESELITLVMQLDAAQRAALKDLLKLGLGKAAAS